MVVHSRLHMVSAAVAVTMAVAIWAYQLWPFQSFDPHQFQNVTPIEVKVASVRTSRDLLRIHCQVTNHAPHEAEEIVLTARAKDQNGRVIAINPLVGVSDLLPNATCETEILLPVGSKAEKCTADVQSTLVRWK